jgi:hypothetical protein
MHLRDRLAIDQIDESWTKRCPAAAHLQILWDDPEGYAASTP